MGKEKLNYRGFKPGTAFPADPDLKTCKKAKGWFFLQGFIKKAKRDFGGVGSIKPGFIPLESVWFFFSF